MIEFYETENFKELIEVFKMRVLCWENISDVDSRDYPHGMIEHHDYDRNTLHYVMKIEGNIIGGARLKIAYELKDIPDFQIYEFRNIPFKWPIGHLGKLIVLPQYQGKGLSKYFDDSRMIKSKELGAKMILGWTHLNSKRLFYKLNEEGFNSAGLINIPNYPDKWELGSGEIIYKML